jgi:hypothetical protein
MEIPKMVCGECETADALHWAYNRIKTLESRIRERDQDIARLYREIDYLREDLLNARGQ